MAICDKCGNYDESYQEDLDYTTDSHLEAQDFQPDLYYYWDSPLEEDYDWRETLPTADCLCEICFDLLNSQGKIKWVESNPFECKPV